jgi:hypothetical protein
MGAVSIIEDMVDRWDEQMPSQMIGTCACRPRSVIGRPDSIATIAIPDFLAIPFDLVTAFEQLRHSLENLDQKLVHSGHLTCWHKVAKTIDDIGDKIERFSVETMLSSNLSDIYLLSQRIANEVEIANREWCCLIGEVEDLISPIARYAVCVQRLNPDHFRARLSNRQQQDERRAEYVQGCWRSLKRLRLQRVEGANECLAIIEAGRALRHPKLPLVDKDAEIA